MGLTPPQRQPGCPGGQEKTVTATGVIRCFEEGEHWAEKGGGGELERGWKRVALERGSGTAPGGRGPSAWGGMTVQEMGESQGEAMAGKRTER